MRWAFVTKKWKRALPLDKHFGYYLPQIHMHKPDHVREYTISIRNLPRWISWSTILYKTNCHAGPRWDDILVYSYNRPDWVGDIIMERAKILPIYTLDHLGVFDDQHRVEVLRALEKHSICCFKKPSDSHISMNIQAASIDHVHYRDSEVFQYLWISFPILRVDIELSERSTKQSKRSS